MLSCGVRPRRNGPLRDRRGRGKDVPRGRACAIATDRWGEVGILPAFGFQIQVGGFPERSKGSDCKSDGNAFEGSNPSLPIYYFGLREELARRLGG